MIKRYFYIFSATLFILLSPTTGIKAVTLEKKLAAIERLQKAPPGFNYQAVLRGDDGQVISNQDITLRMTINSGTDPVVVQWQETHTTSTNQFGLVNLVVGKGERTDGLVETFQLIPWESGDMFLQVEVDTGDGFVNLGSDQLLSVPYAFNANNGMTAEERSKLANLTDGAEANVQSDWNQADNTADDFIENKPTIPGDINELTDNDGLLGGSAFSGSFNDLTDVPTNLDTDATDDFSGDYNDLDNLPTIAFLTAANLTSNAGGDPATDSFVFGSPSLDDDGDPNHDNRMLFEKSSGAFRVGQASGTEWDSRGSFSFAAGANNSASGVESTISGGRGNETTGSHSSISGGYQNRATGLRSAVGGGFRNSATRSFALVAGGSNNEAIGDYSVVGGGRINQASGNYSVIAGGGGQFVGNSASGLFSTIGGGYANEATNNNATVSGGANNNATGISSFVGGGTINTASGQDSNIGGGDSNTASGRLSHIGGGTSNQTSGIFSTISGGGNNHAIGNASAIPGGSGLYAQSLFETAIGSYNTIVTGSPDTFVPTDQLLVIGNGTYSGNRSNALVMLKNGNTDLNGSLVANSLGVDGQFTLPTTDGTSGQVLTTDGSGAASWQDVGGNYSGAGLYSFVAGYNNQATSNYSTVGGGSYNRTYGVISTISGGYYNRTSGSTSAIGGGSSNNASGTGSVIGGGNGNSASGSFSTISGGRTNTVGGSNSFVGGGLSNSAEGDYSSIPGGKGAYAGSYGETAIGIFNNRIYGNKTTRVDTDRLLIIGNGSSNSNTSDALVMLKNGNTDINGSFVANSLGVDGQFTLPTSDGTSGQVLSTDGSGSVSWQTPSGGSSYGGGGTDSFVAGTNSTALGSRSTVSGGYSNHASGNYSSVGGGILNNSSGNYSTIPGGRINTASGYGSAIGGGQYNYSTNYSSTVAGGRNNRASGRYSGILNGRHLLAKSFGEAVVGIYNTDVTPNSINSFDANDRLFIVGNGSSTIARSDAMVILKNGNTDINGTLVANSLGVDGEFTLPTADGTSGQVLSTDGSGSVSWIDASGGSSSIEANQTPVYNAGWDDYQLGEGVTFYKDNSRVYLQGAALRTSGGFVAFTLPVGYRPSDTLFFEYNGIINIRANGEIEVNSNFLNLTGISFRVP